MKKIYLVILLIIGLAGAFFVLFLLQPKGKIEPTQALSKTIKLPVPSYKSNTSVEEALLKRRSIRSYQNQPLTLAELGQIVWSAQGITKTGRNLRTSPSAGATYPLEVYVVVGSVKDLAAGIYKYKPDSHELVLVAQGDKRLDLSKAALSQRSVASSAVVIIFSAVYERTTKRYGQRGVMYAHIEVGHASQNVYLQAVSLKLGTVVIGAFEETGVKKVLHLPADEQPVYLMPVGKI